MVKKEYGFDEKTKADMQDRSLADEVRELKAQLRTTQAQLADLSTPRQDDERANGLSWFVANNVGVIGLKEAITWKQITLKVIWIILMLLGGTATAYYVYKGTSEYLNKEAATKITIQRQSSYEYPDLILCPPWWFNYQRAIAAGLSRHGLLYSLFYVYLPDTYMTSSSYDSFLTPYVKEGIYLYDTYSEALAALKNEANYLRQGQQDFHDFYKRMKFNSLIEFYTWIVEDIGNVKPLNDEDDDEDDYDLADNETIAVRCLGCATRRPEKIIFSNAVCYRFALNKATPRSRDHPVTLRLIDGDNTNGTLPQNSWLMDFVSNVGPIGPSTVLKPYFTYNIKLSAQRTIMMVNASACVDTDKDKAYDQRLCTERCASLLIFNKSPIAQRGTYPSFVVSPNPNETRNYFDSRLKRVISEEARVQRNLELARSRGGNGTVEKPSSINNNQSSFNASLGGLTSNNNSANWPSDDELTACYESCKPPCDRMIYDISTDRQEMDADHKQQKNLSMIEISVRHSAVFQGGIITWQEVPTSTFSDFVSNVGGTLGLFLGCTLFTVAQLVLSCVSYKLDTPNGKQRQIAMRNAVINPSK